MVFSFLISLFFEFGPYGGLEDWQKFVLSVALTTTGWITVTLLTQATPKEKLDEFRASLSLKDGEIRQGLKATLLSTAAIYAILFATGSVIFANYGLALGLFIVSIACGYGVRQLFEIEK
jgi:hypothetical protein